MKSKRNLFIDQLALTSLIRTMAKVNIVTCGHCASVLLHKLDLEGTITCYDCKREMDLSDCPDLFYEGAEDSEVFDEDIATTKEITANDVVSIAMDLNLNPSIAEINEVLKYYDSEKENDTTATWDLIVENLLYNCVETK